MISLKNSAYATVLVLVTGCVGEPVTKTFDLKPVVRVFMHEAHRYTFFVAAGDELKVVEYKYVKEVTLRQDVPTGEPMWVHVTHTRQDFHVPIIQLEIHLHSANEINPAGWNHGKGGRGMTVAVEAEPTPMPILRH